MVVLRRVLLFVAAVALTTGAVGAAAAVFAPSAVRPLGPVAVETHPVPATGSAAASRTPDGRAGDSCPSTGATCQPTVPVGAVVLATTAALWAFVVAGPTCAATSRLRSLRAGSARLRTGVRSPLLRPPRRATALA
ncbi:MAG: hypothetical protein M0029_11150 [Actinomycetota bacterium]|jgi:hypothetical protein|nr:hypothetical protein [Actinomycetota bacterium]